MGKLPNTEVTINLAYEALSSSWQHKDDPQFPACRSVRGGGQICAA